MKKTSSTLQRASKQQKSRSKNFSELGEDAMGVVQQAAALLDEELAAGIVAAKKVQRSVRTKHRVDPSDFREALDKFQSDGHELVGMLGEQLQRPRSKETDELIQRFVGHTQDILDVMVELVNTGAELVNQLGTRTEQGKRAPNARTSRRSKR